MSKLSDALRASRDAFVAMGNTEPLSMARARSIANFYKTNLGLAKALKGIDIDEARATYQEFFGEQSEPSFDDVTGGSSSTAPEPEPDEDVWSDRVNERRARRRKRRRETVSDEDVYAVLGVP